MKYTKPPLSFEQQADQLIGRGIAGDRAVLISRLASVNYYRLSGYWFPFRNTDDTFKDGTTFDAVWDRYVFDRRLRLHVMDAIERIEVAVRSQLAYNHAHEHGPFGYACHPASMPKLDSRRYNEFLLRIEDETARSKEPFVDHFRRKYGAYHKYLPVWMATEIMTFGSVLSLFRGSSHRIKQTVSSLFGMPGRVFESWLMALNTIRNICAHHGRLWNRELGVKPLIPLANSYPDWHAPVVVQNNRMFGVLTICRYCLSRIAPQSHWADRFRVLLSDFTRIPLKSMGFPIEWERCPIWSAPSNPNDPEPRKEKPDA